MRIEAKRKALDALGVGVKTEGYDTNQRMGPFSPRKCLKRMAGTTGLEPAASAVTGQRSNQLNYVPTRQINEMRNRQCLCGTARFAYRAPVAPDCLKRRDFWLNRPQTAYKILAALYVCKEACAVHSERSKLSPLWIRPPIKFEQAFSTEIILTASVRTRKVVVSTSRAGLVCRIERIGSVGTS